MILDLDFMSVNSAYHVLTQVIIPRPIAWVLTEHDNSEYNLAPFFYFSVVCSDPQLMMISIGSKPDGSEKDTYRNIKKREKFIIHIANSTLVEQVTKSSATLAAGQSEVELCGLKTERVEGFPLPRVVGPKVALSCRFYEEKKIGNNDQHLIFGLIEKIWLDDTVVEVAGNDRLIVDAYKVDPLGRLGGGEYTLFGKVLDIPRPD